jgi:signal transduction histidine kinase/CheY-like chemotaxis protein
LGDFDARALVPVQRGGDVMALIALGAKGSGDIYTGSDLAHLATVGARVALELQRYETGEIVRSGREMVDEIRREKQAAEVESRAKTRFLAAASHDLRQPLHALGLYVETLRERMGASEHADLVRQIDRSTATLGETIDELLDVSRLDAGAVEAHPLDLELGPLLERLTEDAAPVAAEKSLDVRLVPTKLRVRSDPVLLARILQNLLVNAVRYTERGRVLVGCRRRGLDVVIEVWDTGPGIPDADRERIFAEFTRGRSPAAAGTGLGLAIVRGMAELLGHEVSFDSQVGRGTVFRVRVPRARARTHAEAGAKPAAVAGQLSGTIALLEDDEAVRAGTIGLLERWGATVVAAATLDGLLAQLEGAPDVIVADYDLGGGPNGLEAISLLRERFGTGIPAMIVTGHGRARASGALRRARASPALEAAATRPAPRCAQPAPVAFS